RYAGPTTDTHGHRHLPGPPTRASADGGAAGLAPHRQGPPARPTVRDPRGPDGPSARAAGSRRGRLLHPTLVTTLERFILDQEREHPEATGELTNVLYDIALAAKLIAAQIRRAGLVNILGAAGATNVQGEAQQKLDVWANETMKNALNHT